MIHSKRHLHFVFDLFVCVSLSPCLQTLRILDFFEGTLGVMYPGCQTLFMRGFRFRSSLACGRRNGAPRRAPEKTSGNHGRHDGQFEK